MNAAPRGCRVPRPGLLAGSPSGTAPAATGGALRGSGAGLLLLALLAGCGPRGGDTDLDRLRETWARDPHAAVRLLDTQAELDQLLAVELVLRDDSGPAEMSVCDGFTLPSVQDRCRQVLTRSHLTAFGVARPGNLEQERACLADLGLAPSPAETPFGIATTALQREGPDMDRGLAICGCLQSDQIRQECTFRFAEVMALAGREDAVDACMMLSRPVAPMCFDHVERLADLRVDLRDPEHPGWSTARAFADHLAQAPAEKVSDDADGLVGFHWSRVMFRAVGTAVEEGRGTWRLAPDLARRLPEEALPHLRSAVAWAVVGASDGASSDPQALVAQARAILEGAAPIPEGPWSGMEGLPTNCGEAVGRGTVWTTAARYHFLAHLPPRRTGASDPDEDVEHAVSAARTCLGGDLSRG